MYIMHISLLWPGREISVDLIIGLPLAKGHLSVYLALGWGFRSEIVAVGGGGDFIYCILIEWGVTTENTGLRVGNLSKHLPQGGDFIKASLPWGGDLFWHHCSGAGILFRHYCHRVGILMQHFWNVHFFFPLSQTKQHQVHTHSWGKFWYKNKVEGEKVAFAWVLRLDMYTSLFNRLATVDCPVTGIESN